MRTGGRLRGRVVARGKAKPSGRGRPGLGAQLSAADNAEFENLDPLALAEAIEEEYEDERRDELDGSGDETDDPDAYDPHVEYGPEIDDEQDARTDAGVDWPEATREGGPTGRRTRPEAHLSLDWFGSDLVPIVSAGGPVRRRMLAATGEFLVRRRRGAVRHDRIPQLLDLFDRQPASQSELIAWLKKRKGQRVSKSAVSRVIFGSFLRLPGAGIVPLARVFAADARTASHKLRGGPDPVDAFLARLLAAEPALTHGDLAEKIWRRFPERFRKRPSASMVQKRCQRMRKRGLPTPASTPRERSGSSRTTRARRSRSPRS